MARPLRIEFSGAIYHIASRGNAKTDIYFDDHDRKVFLNILKKVNIRYNWLCHAYCLMNNHYHLLIETLDSNLSKGMRQLNGVYAQFINKKYNKVGHIFQGRYKAIIIQKGNHLLEACRYIALNPVRSNIAKRPEDWQWSSYRDTIGPESSHGCLTTNWILAQFGSRKNIAQQRYAKFVNEMTNSFDSYINGQVIIGDEGFRKQFDDFLSHYKHIKEFTKKQRFNNKPSLNKLFSKKTSNKSNRKHMVLEAIEIHGYSQKQIADYLNLHYSTISKIIKK